MLVLLLARSRLSMYSIGELAKRLVEVVMVVLVVVVGDKWILVVTCIRVQVPTLLLTSLAFLFVALGN